MKIALKKGVRGAISQKAALGILIDIHQIHLFIIPVHEELSKFTEMKVTLEMNSAEQLGKLLKGTPLMRKPKLKMFRTRLGNHICLF